MLSLKPKKKASSEDKASKKAKPKPMRRSKERNLEFDLFAQLSYLSSMSTAGVSRAALFEFASLLPYSSALYFRKIHLLAQKLNVDYAEGCRLVAEKTKSLEVKGFLLRLAGSLSSGENESEFLRREAEAVGARYGNQYDRDVESLKKWTDAYVTLVVAAGLIVIVSVISMMIYPVGMPIIVGLAVTMIFVTALGGWVLYVSAPKEIKTRVGGPTSPLQIKAMKLFKFLMPLALVVCALMLMMKINLGWVLIVGAAIIFPPGYVINKDDKLVSRLDSDIPTMVRVLGAVTSAIGTTVTQALDQVDRRSMASLMPHVTRLRLRLKAGITPKACWGRLVDETGSELIDRTVTMFWDSLSLGGEAGKIGIAASFYSSKIAFLRATRSMVAATFRWLVLPLHIAMVGLLTFIPQIMVLFSRSIQESSDAMSASEGSSGMPVGELFSFGNLNLGLIQTLVTLVVLVLTLANAFAPKAADGGHALKTLYNLSILMVISGALMLLIPVFAGKLFNSIVG